MSRVRALRDIDWSKPAIRIGASALGLAALVLGAVLIIRPTTSLGVMAWLLGVALVLQAALELLGDRDAERPGNRLAAAALWAAAGVVVFAVPGLTVRVATLVVAGHVWPVQLGFRGGRGLGPLLGAWLVLAPLAIGICLVIAGIAWAITRRRIGSGLFGALLLPATTWWETHDTMAAVFAGLTFCIVALAHRTHLHPTGTPPSQA